MPCPIHLVLVLGAAAAAEFPICCTLWQIAEHSHRRARDELAHVYQRFLGFAVWFPLEPLVLLVLLFHFLLVVF